jgi:hypothetical protein
MSADYAEKRVTIARPPLIVVLLIYRREIALAYSTNGAHPVVWNVFEGCSWGDSTIGIALSGVVNVPTNVANILFHHLAVV